MPIRPKPFKICCAKCDFEKLIWFKSDVLRPLDFEQIPKVCPKCGNAKLNRKTASMSEAIAKEYHINYINIQSFKNMLKKVLKVFFNKQ